MKHFKTQPDSKYFIDTNIWLYSFIQSKNIEKTKTARTIIKECEIFISTQIINEICVNLIKKVGFPEKKIRNLIESLYRKYTVLDLSQEILIKSSKIRANHSFSFWDSLVAASALDCDVDYLISEDMQNGFKLDQKLMIVNPFI
jgi:predicted nucleic acid-binding protein